MKADNSNAFNGYDQWHASSPFDNEVDEVDELLEEMSEEEDLAHYENSLIDRVSSLLVTARKELNNVLYRNFLYELDQYLDQDHYEDVIQDLKDNEHMYD